jgi:hypothetical protein
MNRFIFDANSDLSPEQIRDEFIDKLSHASIDQIGKYLGSGEFSDAYLVHGLVVKVNRTKSLHNPQYLSAKEFTPIALEQIQGEVETNKYLQQCPIGTQLSILPKVMMGFQIRDHYYLIREFGEIPIQTAQENKVLPLWNQSIVTLDQYQIFVDQLFLIAKHCGTFQDFLQPALRSDGSLFLMDLGFFSKQKENYMIVFTLLPHLNDQLSLDPILPLFVIQDMFHFNEDYYAQNPKPWQKAYTKWKTIMETQRIEGSFHFSQLK